MSERTHSTPLALYFALTFALAWALWGGAAVLTSRVNVSAGRTLLFLPGTFAPGIVALWMTYRSSPSGQHRQLLAGLFQWQAPARWYVFAATYMIVAKLTAATVFRFSEGEWPAFGATPIYLLLVATVFSAPFQAGEEIGWRGYALPRLGEAIGFRAASVVLGVIWAVWHLPLFLIAGTDSTGQPFVTFILAVTAVSIAMTWLYLNTHRSLVPVMVMHAAINNTTGIVPSSAPVAPGAFSLRASSMAWITIGVLWVGAGYFLSRMSGSGKRMMTEWRHSDVPAYITDISANHIHLGGSSLNTSCQCAGSIRHAVRGSIRFESDQELVDAINCLVTRGAMLMDYEHSWPPAAVAEDLREKGYPVEGFRKVWFDGTSFRVRD